MSVLTMQDIFCNTAFARKLAGTLSAWVLCSLNSNIGAYSCDSTKCDIIPLIVQRTCGNATSLSAWRDTTGKPTVQN